MPLWVGAGLAGWYLHRRTPHRADGRAAGVARPPSDVRRDWRPALTAHRVTTDEDQPGAREPEAGHDLRRHPGGAQDEQAAQEI